jgi:hypothetical protein
MDVEVVSDQPRHVMMQNEKNTAGSGWYDLPATEVTPEVKKDLQFIKLRGYVDSKRFYKACALVAKEVAIFVAFAWKNHVFCTVDIIFSRWQNDDWKKLPKYFQVGTVVEGAGEYYSARLTNKERAPTLVDQLLRDNEVRGEKCALQSVMVFIVVILSLAVAQAIEKQVRRSSEDQDGHERRPQSLQEENG